MLEQSIVFATLALSLLLFLVGRWRYDVVALLVLLILTLSGITLGAEAFAGFGHPAVVTVVAVLVVSRGLQHAGVVALLSRGLSWVGASPTVQVAALTGLVTVCSGFMNNVGALALLLPVAVQMARKHGHPPSLLLMPLAFGSLLGGMLTVIGTPPNIIIATMRTHTGAAPFRMFDFTPVGLGIAVAGVLFIALIGWRLLPRRGQQVSREAFFAIEDYLTEVRVPNDSPLVEKAIRELSAVTDATVAVVGLVRGTRRWPMPLSLDIIQAGDILLVEASPEDLQALVAAGKLELVGSKELDAAIRGSDGVDVAEAVVMLGAPIEGKTARALNMRWRYGVNLLAVARQGARVRERLGGIRFRAGDVLLLQGGRETLQEVVPLLGCVPLAERGLRLGYPRRVLLATGIFSSALVATSTGLLPVHIAFVGAATLMVLVELVSLREAYESIDWPIIVLLGAMLPLGEALERTGGASLLARQLLALAGHLSPAVMLAMVLIGTMFLSDLINNAAAAVVMAPIAISVARGLGVSPDPFLMGVAVGASCAFLTPIGHQSNTLVMGPGGYRFGDYWRMGLPLEAIIAATAVPLILWVWPIGAANP